MFLCSRFGRDNVNGQSLRSELICTCQTVAVASTRKRYTRARVRVRVDQVTGTATYEYLFRLTKYPNWGIHKTRIALQTQCFETIRNFSNKQFRRYEFCVYFDGN